MSEEFLKAGFSATQQATAKLNDIMNESYEKEVDLMFGRLHEQRSNPESSDYGNNDYDKSDYKRVGFSSRKAANQFAREMESMGVEVTVAPVKLSGQYLVEIPKVNKIPVAPEEENYFSESYSGNSANEHTEASNSENTNSSTSASGYYHREQDNHAEQPSSYNYGGQESNDSSNNYSYASQPVNNVFSHEDEFNNSEQRETHSSFDEIPHFGGADNKEYDGFTAAFGNNEQEEPHGDSRTFNQSARQEEGNIETSQASSGENTSTRFNPAPSESHTESTSSVSDSQYPDEMPAYDNSSASSFDNTVDVNTSSVSPEGYTPESGAFDNPTFENNAFNDSTLNNGTFTENAFHEAEPVSVVNDNAEQRQPASEQSPAQHSDYEGTDSHNDNLWHNDGFDYQAEQENNGYERSSEPRNGFADTFNQNGFTQNSSQNNEHNDSHTAEARSRVGATERSNPAETSQARNASSTANSQHYQSTSYAAGHSASGSTTSGSGTTTASAGSPTGVVMETVTADELINQYKQKYFENVEDVNDKERGESTNTAGQEVAALFHYMASQTDALGSTLSQINSAYKTASEYNANANDRVFSGDLQSDGNVKLNSGTRTAKAVVLNNDTVVINGELVTENSPKKLQKAKEKILKEHHERIERAAKYSKKDAEKRDEWIKKGAEKKKPKVRTEEDWAARRDGRKIQNHPNRARNSQAILDNMYKQEYTAPEVINYASRTGGTLDALKNSINLEAVALGQENTIALSGDELALIRKASMDSSNKAKAASIQGVIAGQDITTFRERAVVKSMLATYKQQNSMSLKVNRLLKKYEGLEAGRTLSAADEKKLGDDLARDIKRESMKNKYSQEVSKPLFEAAQKYESGKISYQELKAEIVKTMSEAFQQQKAAVAKVGDIFKKKKYEDLANKKALTVAQRKKLNDDLLQEINLELGNYLPEVSASIQAVVDNYACGKLTFNEMKDKVATLKNKDMRISKEEIDVLEGLTCKNPDGSEGGKLALSAAEQAMFSESSKLIEALSRDFNIDLSSGTLSRADLLKINQDFINRAAEKGYQFVTPSGKFDVQMLKNLSKEDLLRLGISEESRKMLIKLNEKGAWGGKNEDLAHTGIGSMLIGKGMQVVGDEDLQKMVNTTQKGVRYVRQVRTSVHQFSEAMRTKIDIQKAKRAGKKVKKKSGKPKSKQTKPKTPSTQNARPVNAKANEKYLKNQEKQLKRLERSEKGLIGKTRKSINERKQKFANNKFVKGLTKALDAVKKFLIEIIAIFVIIILLLEAFVVIGIVVVTMIQSLLNCLKGLVEKAVPDYFDQSVIFNLYEKLQKEENDWIELVKDPEASFDAKGDLQYGMNYDTFTAYIDSIDNLIADGSDNLYINPFWRAGNNTVSLGTNKRLLTEIEDFDGENTVRFSANVSLYGNKNIEDTVGSTYVSTESGHTSNLKDILAMLDVIYVFEPDDASDEGLTDSLGGITPAQLNWEDFKNNVLAVFKWAKTNLSVLWDKLTGGSVDDDDYVSLIDVKGHTVNYKTLQNYVVHLFELSHQQQNALTVDYYSVGDVSAKVNGTLKVLNLSQEEASKIHVCVEPVTKKFQLAYNTTSRKIVPCIIDSNGAMHDLSTGEHDVTLSMTNGTYTDDDQCLWDGMGSNEATLNAIKNYIDNYFGGCWYYSHGDSKVDEIPIHFVGDNWYDTEGEAKTEVYNKMVNKWNEYLDNPLLMGTPSYTLNANKTLFTHIWYRLYSFSYSDIIWEGVTTRKVQDGVDTYPYYWDDWTTISKPDRKLVTGDVSNSGYKAAYIYSWNDGTTLLDMDDYDTTMQWFTANRNAGNFVNWIQTDSYCSFATTDAWVSNILTYYDYKGGTKTQKKAHFEGDHCAIVVLNYCKPHMKTQYKVTGATVHMYDKITDIYKRNCQGHDFTYCGGHVSFHTQGLTYSMTNEQLAMVGCYNDESQYPTIKDFDYEAYGYKRLIGKYEDLDWDTITSVGQASTSGGSQSPMVNVQGSYTAQRGLNLYTDGANVFKQGYYVHEGCMKLVRDIFDVDCMVDKGCNVFPFGSSYEEYSGWNADNMELAIARTTIDWYDLYGFDIPIELGGNTIAEEDVGKLIEALKDHYGANLGCTDADSAAQREEAIRTALTWVGRGHYNEYHTDHDFLTELCHAHGVEKIVNGERIPDDDWFDVNCTASDDKGFVRFVLDRAGIENPSLKLISSRTYTGYNTLKPADIIIHRADTGSWSRDANGKTHVVYNDLNISAGDSLSFFSDDILSSYADEKYVIFLGVIDEDLELRGMDGDSITIKAGVPITIDLNCNRDIGTVRLRTKTATSWSDSGEKKNYYWVTTPDSKTKYVSFN